MYAEVYLPIAVNHAFSYLIPKNFKKTTVLKKSGLAGFFSASLELTKEGLIKIMQEKDFGKILIRQNNE